MVRSSIWAEPSKTSTQQRKRGSCDPVVIEITAEYTRFERTFELDAMATSFRRNPGWFTPAAFRAGCRRSRYDRRLSEILVHRHRSVLQKRIRRRLDARSFARERYVAGRALLLLRVQRRRLLYLIQKHTFSTIVQRLKSDLEGVSEPEERIRIFILNHLEYFLANQAAMKVLSHEDEALKNGFGSEVAAIKREYYRICVGLLDELKRDRGLQFSTRIAVLSLFGMMNWIYTWHNPRVDADAAAMAARDGRYLSARGARTR